MGMSETEAWHGKAKVVKPREGEDIEALCKRICDEKNIEKQTYHDSSAEALQDLRYNQYIVVENVLYDMSDKQRFETDYMCHAQRIDENTIEFKMIFHNGGTCLSEMFEGAVSKLK